MKTFWRNPLVYKEWKSVRWITLLMTLSVLFTKVMVVMDRLRWIKEVEAGRGFADIKITAENFLLITKYWFNQALLGYDNQMYVLSTIGCMIILTIVLFHSERGSKTYELLASMPFKRKDIITTKWCMGIFSIFLSSLAGFTALSIFYKVNIRYIQDPYSIVFQWFLLHMVMFMLIFTILFFIQTLMGQNIVAGVVGPIIIAAPWFITMMTSELLRINFGLTYENRIIRGIEKIGENIILYDFGRTEYVQIIQNGILEEINYFGYGDHYLVYKNYNLKIVLAVLLIGIVYALSVYAYNRNAFEKNGSLSLFTTFEWVLKVGVAICSGLLLSAIFGLGYSNSNIFVADIFLIIGSALGYFITSKAIKLTASSNK